MKALLSTFVRSSLVIVCLSYSACVKDPHNPSHIPECRVYQITGDVNYSEDSITIRYNSKGNPIAIDRNNVGTGNPHFVFKYDKNDRLIDLIGLYDHPTNYETRFRFAYDYKNRIKADTQYIFGFTDQPNTPENINEYEYDSQNRMTQYHHRSLIWPDTHWTYTFEYNQQGNLAKVTDENGTNIPLFPFDYDDKVNINSLHPIWQFLSQDYSRNNHATEISYNNKGLPTEIDRSTKVPGGFANIYISHVKVSYQCR